MSQPSSKSERHQAFAPNLNGDGTVYRPTTVKMSQKLQASKQRRKTQELFGKQSQQPVTAPSDNADAAYFAPSVPKDNSFEGPTPRPATSEDAAYFAPTVPKDNSFEGPTPRPATSEDAAYFAPTVPKDNGDGAYFAPTVPAGNGDGAYFAPTVPKDNGDGAYFAPTVPADNGDGAYFAPTVPRDNGDGAWPTSDIISPYPTTPNAFRNETATAIDFEIIMVIVGGFVLLAGLLWYFRKRICGSRFSSSGEESASSPASNPLRQGYMPVKTTENANSMDDQDAFDTSLSDDESGNYGTGGGRSTRSVEMAALKSTR